MTRPEHVVGLVRPWVEYADELEARIEELEEEVAYRNAMLRRAWDNSDIRLDKEFADAYKALGEGE